MNTPDLIASAHAIFREIKNEGKFLTSAQADTLTLAGGDFARLRVIVRFNANRLVCQVRDLRERLEEETTEQNYLRDVSIHPEDTFPRDSSDPEQMTLPELKAELARVQATEDAHGAPFVHTEDYLTDLIDTMLHRFR